MGKHILVLHAHESNAPLFQDTDKALARTLQSGGMPLLNQFFESLDLRRNPDPEYRRQLVAYLDVKYRHRKFDLIITMFPEALDFVLNEGRTLFPNVPILALYLPVSMALPRTERRIVRHSAPLDMVGTLEIALNLVPGARRVYVVSGAHELDRQQEEKARREFKPWEDRLEFRYLSQIPLEEILTTLASAPPDTVVLFLVYSTDVRGTNYTAPDLARRLSQASAAPVFGLLDVELGHGIVGGALINYERIGIKAGLLALDFLRGSPASANVEPVLNVPAVPMFDWRQLRRWNLSVDAVPPGSIIINREYTLWEHYHWQILVVLMLITAQALTILVLLAHRKYRREAELTLQGKEERLRLAIHAAALGVWSWNLSQGQTRPSEQGARKRPVTQAGEVTYEEFLGAVHSEDRDRVDAAVQQAIQTRKEYEIEYRISQRDGAEHWMSSRGSCTYDREGKPLRMTGVSHDITERKRAEEERQLLAAVVESSPDAIYSLDPDDVITSWNPGAEQLFGYTAAEVKGQPVWFLVPPESREETMRALKRIKAGEAISRETARCRKDGTRIEVSMSSAPIRNAAEDIVGATTTLRDIRAQKRAEKALAESQALILAVFDSTDDFIWSVDPHRGGLLTFNRGLRDYVFRQRGIEIRLGMTPEEMLPPEYAAQWHAFYSRALREGSFVTEYVVVARTHVLLLSLNVLKQDDKVFGISVFGKDITERKRTEAALHESEDRFRQVAENVADFIWEVDAEGLYRYTSPSVEKILGYRPEELVGKVHFYDLFAPELRAELTRTALGVFAAKQTFRAFPNPNVSKQGKLVDLETSAAPVLDADGKLLGYRGADTDVTERKRAALEADRLRRELAHISRVTMLGELTASLAHELNQPLAAIVSNAQAGERFLAAP
ncbi:MAG TPA: PAS domain S-box protein, partial [Candidatus Methylomirabilis sp.]|nr:PAS domain S-box protein [Candidatus Methylomirabilis sp.]